MRVSRGLLAVVMLALAVPVCAQSLGDLAKKEQERRKTQPAAKKVYTNDDLQKITPPGGAAPADAAKPGDPAATSGDAAKDDGKGDGKADGKGDAKAPTEAEWRG